MKTQKYHLLLYLLCPLFLALAGLVIFVSIALLAAHQHFLPGEALVYRFVQEARSPGLYSFFRLVTKAGTAKVLVPVGLGVLLWKRNQPQVLLFLSLYSLGVIILERGVKLAVARPRPHDYLGVGLPFHTSHGFPSGHALAATAFYGMLLVLLRQKIHSQRGQLIMTTGILLLIVLISFSRLYLGVHWPGDVLGGLLLGGVYCVFATTVGEWIGKRAGVRLDVNTIATPGLGERASME